MPAVSKRSKRSDPCRSSGGRGENFVEYADFPEKHNLIHFACFQKHIGLYPGPEAVEEFREQLSGYKTSKGAIHLPYDKPLPVELIQSIAKWCYETDNL